MKNLLFSILIFCTNFTVLSQYSSVQDLTTFTYIPKLNFQIDLDLDGDLDIVYLNNNGLELVWHENLGNGNLAQRTSLHSFDKVNDKINISDYDQDGDYDLLIFENQSFGINSLKWIENDGNLTFLTNHIIASNIYKVTDILTVDLNNDGLDDILISEHQSTQGTKQLSYFEGLGNGSFSQQNIIDNSFDYPYRIQSDDLDNDGDKDILVLDINDEKIFSYENLGNLNFSSQQTPIHFNSGNLDIMKIKDLDNDGLNDIIFNINNSILAPNKGIYWSKNLGNNSFAPYSSLIQDSIFIRDFELVDVDNDQDLDLIFANQFALEDSCVIEIHLNDGNANFSFISSYNNNTHAYVSHISSGDFTGNGYVNILLTYTSGQENIDWIEIDATGSILNYNKLFDQLNGPIKLLVEDMNNDGLKDFVCIMINEPRVCWYKNLGNNQFSEQIELGLLTPSNYGRSIAVEDIDQDGDLDIYASGNDTIIHLFENLGADQFSSPQVAFNDVDNVPSLCFEDFDNDGDKDLFLVNISEGIYYYENLGSNQFGNQTQLLNSPYINEIQFTDLNNDSYSDIVYCYSSGVIKYLLNTTTGGFGPEQSVGTSTDFAFTLVDLDGDGYTDIITSLTGIYQNKVLWYKNNNGSNFQSGQILTDLSYYPGDVQFLDVDNDGDLDMFVPNGDKYSKDVIAYYENLGNQQFGPKQIIVEDIDGIEKLFLEDLDLDGDYDLSFICQNSDRLAIVLNFEIIDKQARGHLFIDLNQNSQLDSTDIPFPQAGINVSPTPYHTTVYPDGEFFSILEDSIPYTFQPIGLNNWMITTDSVSFSILADSSFYLQDSLDFGFTPSQVIDSLQIDVAPTFPRCNDTVMYWVNYGNLGTSLPSGIIHFHLDDSVSYYTSDLVPDSIVGQDIYWSFDSLMYFSDNQLNIFTIYPDFNSIGDKIVSTSSFYLTDINGLIYDTLVIETAQELVCAYDPNDKTATPGGIGYQGFIHPDTEELEYLIRFQNTGNDTSQNVRITDVLSPYLDWRSFIVLGSSHDMNYIIDSVTGEVEFNFNNIFLPDSNVNFFGSQGYVKYKINIDSATPTLQNINNTANIYFDLNPEVITNTTINTLFECDYLNLNFPLDEICEGEMFKVSTYSLGVEFDWEIQGVEQGTGKIAQWITDSSGIFTYEMQSTPNSYCFIDTIFTFEVFPEEPLNILDTIDICYGEIVEIFGIPRYSSGTYTQTLSNSNGCDSTVAKILNVTPFIPNTIIDTLNICQGDSVYILGEHVKQAGWVTDTLQSFSGCDSTIAYLINVHTPYLSQGNDTLTICNGDSVLVFGQYENQEGWVTDTLQTVSGCDSTLAYYIEVNVNFIQNIPDTLEICDGDSLEIFGTYQTVANLYTYNGNTNLGCDSLRQTYLVVHPKPIIDFNNSLYDTTCINYSEEMIDWATPSGGVYSGSSLINGTFNPELAGQGLHWITYTYTNQEGCANSDSISIFVDGCLGISDYTSHSIDIHPNPFSSTLYIDLGDDYLNKLEISLYSATGKLILQDIIDKQVYHLQRNQLKSGVYTLVLLDKDTQQEIINQKIVIID